MVWQPDCTSRDTLSEGDVRTTSRKRSQTSGIGWSPVGSPVLAATTRANRPGCSATNRSPIRPPQSCPTSVRPRRSRWSNASARIHSTCRAKLWSPISAGLSERPNPTRSAAMTRSPASASTGMTLRYRNDQLGSPCSSRTGSPSAGRFPRTPAGARRPRRTAVDNRSRAGRRNGVQECAAPSCRHAVTNAPAGSSQVQDQVAGRLGAADQGAAGGRFIYRVGSVADGS